MRFNQKNCHLAISSSPCCQIPETELKSQIRKNATMTVKYWKKLKNGLLTLGKDLSQRRVELIHFRLGRGFSPLRTLNVTTCNYLTQTTQAAQQCFGSGIRCLFDHLDLGSAFQNRVFLDLGSHIPNPYF